MFKPAYVEKKMQSWGRLSRDAHHVATLADAHNVADVVAADKPGNSGIAYGMGRSYGDVCLNPGGTLWQAGGLNRFVSFDEATGRLVCEAGVCLRDIQRIFVPRGWMLAVTPGTQLVTVGGAIANDVHGKNHHKHGTFGHHVLRLTLAKTDGSVVNCTRDENAALFAATIGGLGLTGVITTAEIQLRPVKGPWLEVEKIPFDNLDAFYQLADSSEQAWEYTVAWIDCLSADKSNNVRGIFSRGRHIDETADAAAAPKAWVKPAAKKMSLGITPPLSLVNKLSLRLFNALYYAAGQRSAGRHITHYEPFLYPLDHVQGWNRLYGPKGFYQYQCVIPEQNRAAAIREMLATIAASGTGSFLAVLKTFGDHAPAGLLSFPQKGVTLALDFPNKREKTESLFARLDAITAASGGRIYLAKDARMPKSLFEAGYKAVTEFLPHKDKGISSALSRRLIGL